MPGNYGGRGGAKRPYFESNWKQAQQQHQNAIGPGLCGLFFTAEDERRAVREARNLIEHNLALLDKDDGDESNSKAAREEDNKDIADALKANCEELHKQGSDKRIALRQLETGARCTLFFVSPKITPENVYILAEQMAKQCQEDAQTRFLAKVIPIEETVPAYMDQIMPALGSMLVKQLAAYSSAETPPSYAIDFKARNTKLIEKQKVYDEVGGNLVKEHSPGSAVNLTQPDLLIVVHAIRTTAFLAIIRNYDKYRKYSLRKPTEEQQEGKEAAGAETSSAAQNDEKEEEKEGGE